MTTDNRKGGEFFINSITLSNQFKESVEITKLITGFRLYESIYKKYTTGEVHFIDGLNLIKNFRFTGQEFIRVSISMKQGTGEKAAKEDSIDRDFRVYKASNINRVNDTTQTYVLRLCDPRMFACERVRVSKAMRGSYDKMLQNILVEDVKMKPEEFDSWETTMPDNNQMIWPNWKVSRIIDWITQNSSIGNKTSFKNGMFFFQTLNGKYKFKSIDSMMEQEYPLSFSFRPRTENLDTGETDINAPSGLNTQIISYTKPQAFDTLRGTIAGAYASSMKVYDPVRKIEEDIVFDLEESFKKGNHVSGKNPIILTDGGESFTEMTLTTEDIVDKFVSPNVTEVDANLAPNKAFDSVVVYDYTTTHVFDQSTSLTENEVFQGQKNKDNAKLERQSMMEILQQHTMVVSIPFRTDISCGTIIKLELPEPQLASNAESKDKLNDGRYLITDICFQGNVLENGGLCNIECVKESFAKSITSINPQDTMEAPEDD